ncbi:MAG TPA: hypothetical protein PLG17_08465, partial [Thermodesulfobacteriota bacterium]|nr:hypothetical protein [Thermodesulfobacteriota bacterium]
RNRLPHTCLVLLPMDKPAFGPRVLMLTTTNFFSLRSLRRWLRSRVGPACGRISSAIYLDGAQRLSLTPYSSLFHSHPYQLSAPYSEPSRL